MRGCSGHLGNILNEFQQKQWILFVERRGEACVWGEPVERATKHVERFVPAKSEQGQRRHYDSPVHWASKTEHVSVLMCLSEAFFLSLQSPPRHDSRELLKPFSAARSRTIAPIRQRLLIAGIQTGDLRIFPSSRLPHGASASIWLTVYDRAIYDHVEHVFSSVI